MSPARRSTTDVGVKVRVVAHHVLTKTVCPGIFVGAGQDVGGACALELLNPVPLSPIVFAGIAEFERELIHERTGVGRVSAKARGVRFGRPPKLTADQIALARRLIAEGTSVPEASKILKVHRATLYRALET